MRAFLALTLDPPVLAFLREYMQPLGAYPWAHHVRWTSETTWHVTMRFLGEVTPTQAESLKLDLAQRAPALTAPVVRITPPVFFPSSARPRVVAAKVTTNAALQALHQACERAATSTGLPPERRDFRGHITLGRCKDDFPSPAPLDLPPAAIAMTAQALTLFRSDFKPHGSVYTELAAFALSLRS